MEKFRKKPVVIEAVKFTGSNDKECIDFCNIARDPEEKKANLIIPTLEGDMLCSVGDWIIKGVNGEFYPCKPDIFEKTYERVIYEEISKKAFNWNFGQAIEALKQGKKVARAGWNGKGMWLKHINYQPCNQAGHNDYGDEILIYDELPSEMELLPWIGMKTADDKFVPWLASQTDMLAEDWQIVE